MILDGLATSAVPKAQTLGLRRPSAVGPQEVNDDGFPVALGVIRDVDAPTYNDAVEAQIEEVKAKKPYHSFAELLETNDIWEVK